MSSDLDAVVVGAGAVGLSIAHAVGAVGRAVTVLERHSRAGTEVSQRSSEVIHAGLYYPPGSLKARLCRQGNSALYQFATDHQITVRRWGKLIVATGEADIALLDVIARNAAACGAGDLVRLTHTQARELEPELECLAALFSPSTGVIDSHGLIAALEGCVSDTGGDIVFNTEVTGLSQNGDGSFTIDVTSAGSAVRITARTLIIAAGLGASHLGAMLAVRPDYRFPVTYYAKGHYFALRGSAPFRHLVYPIPTAGGLGIHLSLDVAGAARFGPDIAWKDEVSYGFEDLNGERLATFEHAVRRYWPGLPDGALAPATTGIRPKITRAGEPAADFAIHGPAQHGVENLIALYGIDSPGLTSALAIGDYVAKLLGAR